ncbi:Serine/threonine-protein kinase cst-1 [Toxocara canis]|uniref:Serine/threonine-protein kinase cst-1 n=1 Tax=Toxocara canis TaxID=6265 RepID=A0A0B2VEV3_TOXCA|nr:Serine/threonine-protein kinase cst-1 [Toxocara canis]
MDGGGMSLEGMAEEKGRRGSEASSDYFKLDATALNKPPEQVFDIVGKLGEGFVSRKYQSQIFC